MLNRQVNGLLQRTQKLATRIIITERRGTFHGTLLQAEINFSLNFHLKMIKICCTIIMS